MSNNYEEELYHYGKLGMRWGIRRRAQKIVKNTPNRIKSEKEQRRASVNKALESIDSKSENPKYGKGSNNTYKKLRGGYNLVIGSYNDALGYQIPTSVSNGRFAANYTKDVVNNNPQLRKLKDNVKNSPQVRKAQDKAQDKVNEYKSKLKKKVSR